ncbi:MAG: hypothetical protein LCI00_28665 [Chloroflexi bacterium]|nr:hypothetical protein [Chloroflexota bacterium]MCC6891520.1 hypothetical protein [Anaerolineae bacterium]
MDTPFTSTLIGQPSRSRLSAFQWRVWLPPVFLFGAGFGVALALLLATSGFVSNDDYYHARIAAQIMAQGRLRVDFPWLPLTILNDNAFVDHHLLYHLYLAPWMTWGGVPGAKVAQALVVGGLLVAVWVLLRSLGVRLAAVWTLGLLAVSAPFLYRMLMVRTQAAAVLLVVVSLYLLFQKRCRWLIVLGFAFTWLYNGFVLLPLVVFLYGAAVFMTERRLVWKPLAFVLLGTALGLVINPYFPQNISFIVNHLGEKVDLEGSIRVGNEWYPYTTRALLENSLGALLVMGAGLLAPGLRQRGRDAAETTLLLVAFITLYMLFESRRFVEYFPAFALLFGAAAIGREGIDWQAYIPARLRKPALLRLYPLVLLLPVLVLGARTVTSAREDVLGAADVGYMAGAAAWLQANTPAGSLVFQTDWDDFTYLYFHNTHNTYLVGLDPTYLQVEDPNLWNIWVPITQGMVERPSVLIRERFGAAYVVSDKQHEAFMTSANGDPDMMLVYEDADSMVWQVAEG